MMGEGFCCYCNILALIGSYDMIHMVAIRSLIALQYSILICNESSNP